MGVRSELFCHGCDSYVQFTLDDSLDGNHKIVCPNCGHEHYRVIKNGEITGDRYNPYCKNVYSTTQVSWTNTSTYTTYSTGVSGGADATGGDVFLYGSWMNTTSSGG